MEVLPMARNYVKNTLILALACLGFFSQTQGMHYLRRTIGANPVLKTHLLQPTLKKIGIHQSFNAARYIAPQQSWGKQTIFKTPSFTTKRSFSSSIYQTAKNYFSSIYSKVFKHKSDTQLPEPTHSFNQSISEPDSLDYERDIDNIVALFLAELQPALYTFDYERDIDDIIALFKEESNWLCGAEIPSKQRIESFKLFLHTSNVKVLRTASQFIGFIVSNSMAYNGYILFIAINKEFQGKGFGKQLIQTVLHDFENEGIETAYLSVYSNNYNARAVYEKMGFTLSENSAEFDEAVVYKKQLGMVA